jgi:hypothetical protein
MSKRAKLAAFKAAEAAKNAESKHKEYEESKFKVLNICASQIHHILHSGCFVVHCNSLSCV